MNQQPAERRVVYADVTALSVHSIFRTIQGEGPFSGFRAVFVRLAGCNLQCPGCDTDYTTGRASWAPRSILSKIDDLMPHDPCPDGGLRRRLVVITGGEPFRQPAALLGLVKLLAATGTIHVQIETNGTLGLHDKEEREAWETLIELMRVTIICSPKTGRVHADIAALIEESQFGAYKYVLDADHIGEDGLPTHALGHPASPQLARPEAPSIPLYLQPEDSGDPEKNKRNLAAVVDSCQKNGYILCLQVHKIIGVP